MSKSNVTPLKPLNSKDDLQKASQVHAEEILKLEAEIAQHQHAYASTFSNIAIQVALKMVSAPLANKEEGDELIDSVLLYTESLRSKLDDYKSAIAPEAEVHPDVYRHIEHLRNQKELIDIKLSAMCAPLSSETSEPSKSSESSSSSEELVESPDYSNDSPLEPEAA